jgi:hypothetical protein
LIDTELPPFDQPIPNDFNHLHFGGGQTEAEVTLKHGEHTLQLLMGDKDHIPHTPPVFSKRLKVRVVDRRTGNPISLCLIYMLVARRLHLPVAGIGMPGHFLVKHYDVDGHAILIDAFERGSIVTEEDCRRKLDSIYSGQVALQPEFLLAVTRRQMLTRMLNNLRSVYLSQRDFRRAVQVVDLVLVIYPRSPEDVKQRAVLRGQLAERRHVRVGQAPHLVLDQGGGDEGRGGGGRWGHGRKI